MKNVLIFGGNSDERLVSAATAQNLMSKFVFDEIWYVDTKANLYQVTSTELAALTNPFLNEFKPSSSSFDSMENGIRKAKDRAFFLAFHGAEGEDGKIQGIMEQARIPFTGTGSKASALAFDKLQTKAKMRAHNQPVASELLLGNEEKALRDFFSLHQKIVVKPVANGSSVGLHIIDSLEKLNSVISQIISSPFLMMAEKFLVGREMTITTLMHQGKLIALPASEVVLTGAQSFDYNGKYLGKGTEEITPAKVSDGEMLGLQELALSAHQILGCYGYSRTDIILTESGPVFLETNTLPGLTKASFVPQQLAVKGIKVEDFVAEQIMLAKQRFS